MKNWSLKAKILGMIFVLVIVSGTGFANLLYQETRDLVLNDARAEAHQQIMRSLEMFMVPTRTFHEEFKKARTEGMVETQLVIEDWNHTLAAVDESLTHDFGPDAVRIRFIGDAGIFGIEPLGPEQRTGITIPFEREAAQRIAGGAAGHESFEEGWLRLSVPMPSQTHPGCAACHQGLRKGIESDLGQNVMLGTLNVYVPLQKVFLKERGKAMQVVYVVLIMLIAIGLVIYYYMNYALTQPIAATVAFTKKVAEGDLSGSIEFRNNDETGVLADSMNRMVRNLRELAHAAEKIADGDLTVQFAVLSDQDTLGHSLKSMVKKLSGVITEINIAAKGVLTGAEQLSATSQSLSQGAAQQASSLQEVTSLMTEIASQAKRNSENATTATRLAGDARFSAEKGDKQTLEMAASMGEIREASRTIAGIIKIIDEIAFQTNLLALNAAVEAARAGRHGKGFAVVAEEVRNLAARSARAAQQTEEMIEGALKKVEAGNAIAGRTAEALHEIVAAAVKVTDLIGEIAVSSSVQAQGVSQITQGLSQVDRVTQLNTAHAEQSASASQELAGQARGLQHLVSAFTLTDSERR